MLYLLCRLVLGPLGSICDMTTVMIMWYFYGYGDTSPDSIVMFHTAWYIEGVVSQVRSPRDSCEYASHLHPACLTAGQYVLARCRRCLLHLCLMLSGRTSAEFS